MHEVQALIPSSLVGKVCIKMLPARYLMAEAVSMVVEYIFIVPLD